MVGPPSLGSMPGETPMISPDLRSDVRASESPSEGSKALVRLGWMLGGTMITLIAWFTLVSSPAWTFGLRDVVFWSGVLVSLSLRYLDVMRFQGQTSDGEPATMGDFRRYALGLAVIAGAGWAVAQAVHI